MSDQDSLKDSLKQIKEIASKGKEMILKELDDVANLTDDEDILKGLEVFKSDFESAVNNNSKMGSLEDYAKLMIRDNK